MRESAMSTEQAQFPLEAWKPTKPPSSHQQAIYDWVKDGTGNAVVKAVAGSGKTTTLLGALHLTAGKVLFTAFNQSIAEELKRRAPAHVRVSTLHGLGLKAVRRAYGFFDVDNDGVKLGNIIQASFPDEVSANDMKRVWEMRGVARKIVSLAKATLVDAKDPAAVVGMVDHYGLDVEELQEDEFDQVVSALPTMLDACSANRDLVDFDDMIWLPAALGLKVERFDWVFVDEAQDMNRSQLELILKAGDGRTRFCCVGDPKQAIYGFRGADTRAMDTTIERLRAKIFPLSITYRCPTSHVKLAQQIVPELEARTDAPEGSIRNLKLVDALPLMTNWDLVLCRTNAPLVRVAFSLIRLGKKAAIRGRDIAGGLAALIKKVGGRNHEAMPIDTFTARLEKHAEREYEKLKKAKKSPLAFQDKVETLLVLSEEIYTVRELLAKVNSIFDDKAQGVACSSVHRAKGLEADRVFIVAPELMPHPMAELEWEIEQEQHIRYVALTRSKNELYFVEMPKEEDMRRA
jgi:DNA helicase-2/ATP-dependent DNA helicase PcrA